MSPLLLERIFAPLIPRACREEVLGDLHERYRTPAAYLAGILSVLPRILWSQARRAVDPQLFLIEALLVYAALIGMAWEFARPFLYAGAGFSRIAAQTLATLAGLLLADIYHPRRHATRMSGFASIVAAQAALCFAGYVLDVPVVVIAAGAAVIAPLLSGLRAIFPPTSAPLR